jgi:hypothetical protein
LNEIKPKSFAKYNTVFHIKKQHTPNSTLSSSIIKGREASIELLICLQNEQKQTDEETIKLGVEDL